MIYLPDRIIEADENKNNYKLICYSLLLLLFFFACYIKN